MVWNMEIRHNDRASILKSSRKLLADAVILFIEPFQHIVAMWKEILVPFVKLEDLEKVPLYSPSNEKWKFKNL